MKEIAVCGYFTFALSVLLIYLQAVTKYLRLGHLMCTYKSLKKASMR